MARKTKVMITYNNQQFTNFADFVTNFVEPAKIFADVNFEKVDFKLPFSDVNMLTKEHVNVSGVYEINTQKFYIHPLLGTYTEISENGNKKVCKNLLLMYLEHPNKKGDRILKINDRSQLIRSVGALCEQNPSGIKAGKSKKTSLTCDVNADNIAQQKVMLDALIRTLEPLTEIADVADNIASIRSAVRSVWAHQLRTQRAEARKADALKTLSGLTPEQIEKLMALI